MSILFLLYVFCFLLQESSCCNGSSEPKEKKPKPVKEKKPKKEKPPKKEKEKDKKGKEGKDKKEDGKNPAAPPAPPPPGDKGVLSVSHAFDLFVLTKISRKGTTSRRFFRANFDLEFGIGLRQPQGTEERLARLRTAPDNQFDLCGCHDEVSAFAPRLSPRQYATVRVRHCLVLPRPWPSSLRHFP